MKEFAVTFQKRNQSLSCIDWSHSTMMHKCSRYCKRTKKYGSIFITKCTFGFPREATDTAVLNNVEDCLKSKAKIYCLARTSEETRVSDYNPLLLRNESDLLKPNETAEQSFARHYKNGSSMLKHHERLQQMLQAQTKVQEINEARQANSADREHFR